MFWMIPWLVCMIAAPIVAHYRGGYWWLWALIAVVLGPLALPLAWFFASGTRRPR